MTTLVGTQKDFSDAVSELIELEYDAKEAYVAAVDRVENKNYKKNLMSFLKDHERHITELSNVLVKHHKKAPTTGGTGKNLLTVGKVLLGNLFGDRAILKAMQSNEIDANVAYERMSIREDQWEDIRPVLKKARDDQQKHKQWLNSSLNHT